MKGEKNADIGATLIAINHFIDPPSPQSVVGNGAAGHTLTILPLFG